MRIIVADDEADAVNDLKNELEKITEDSTVYSFQNEVEVLRFVMKEKLNKRSIDLAFLDIEMVNMNGIELSRDIQEMMPDIKIVIVTGYSKYALDAFSIHAQGFLLKPVITEDVEREVRVVQKEIMMRNKYDMDIRNQGIYIQTFGHFEIFKDGLPIPILRKKSKEILAYLVDRKGALVSSAEIASAVWDDKALSTSLMSNFRSYLSFLINDLKRVDCDNLLLHSSQGTAIDRTKVRCDYYSFLTGDPFAINAYTGEYMSNYSWGETTNSGLSMHKYNSEEEMK